MTTCDRSQCPELISNYDFNGHCPRVNFVYYVNKYLLVTSFKLETAELIRNSVTKMLSSMYRLIKIFNIYFSLMYTVKPSTELRISDRPSCIHTSSKSGKTLSSVSQNRSSPYTLTTGCLVYIKDTSIGFKPKNSSNDSSTGLRDIDFLGYHCFLVPGNFFHHIPRSLVV